MKSTLITFSCLALLPFPAVHAVQQIADNAEITGTLTLRQDVFMDSSFLSLGRLPTTQAHGLRIEVTQATATTEHEDVTPGHYENQTNYVDDYGWVSQSQTIWVEDYGYYNTNVWVDDWGYTYPSIWVDTTYDEEGNTLTPSHWETSTSAVWAITGGHWESHDVWGIIGGHPETAGTDIWGIVGSHPEVTSTWVDEVRSSYTTTEYGIPQTRFVGQVDNMVWSWLNNGRELLEVSNAGVSIPHPGDQVGASRAVLTSTQFEQSYLTPAAELGDYLSYGVRVAKDGIETWNDVGLDQVVSDSHSAKLKPHELLIQTKVPSSSGVTTSTVGTRIAATDASFGGSIRVAGAILIQPQGDISMGAYTKGPKP